MANDSADEESAESAYFLGYGGESAKEHECSDCDGHVDEDAVGAVIVCWIPWQERASDFSFSGDVGTIVGGARG